MREYDPCLRCGDVRSTSGSSKVRIGATSTGDEESRRRDVQEQVNQFSIGDDEDDDDEENESEGVSRPPSYKEDNHFGDEQSEVTDVNSGGAGKEAEVEMEVVEITHPVGRGDTLMSVARKYAADVSHPFHHYP